MKRNGNHPNPENESRQMKRHKKIIELIESKPYKNIEDIRLALGLDEISKKYVSQATLTRDFKVLGIEKEEGVYVYVSRTKAERHQKNLSELIQNHVTTITYNPTIHILQAEDGKASEIAFHLLQGFAKTVVHVQVDGNILIVYLQSDTDDEELWKLLGK